MEGDLVDVKNREEMATWLRARPREVSVVVAARAALRALPLLGEEPEFEKRDKYWQDIVLPVFRAIAVGSAVSGKADPAAIKAATAAYSAATRAATAAADAATAATAARAATNADLQAIDNGVATADLAVQKLWPSRPPPVARAWTRLKTALLAREGEHWEVWTDWYEARLEGKPAIEALEIARATIPDEMWKQGPAVVNAEIKRLIEDFTPTPPGVAAEALRQRASAFSFRARNGKIDVLPEDAVAIDRETAEDLYGEAKRKAEELAARLQRIQADAPLRRHVERLITRLGAERGDMRPGLILSTLRSLQSDVRAYDTDAGRKELVASDLSLLVDVTETTRDLVALFPKAREIEADAVVIDLPMERLDAVATEIEVFAETVARSDGATEPAKAAVTDSLASIPNQRSPADRAKQLAYCLLDIGNFARAGLSYVRDARGKLSSGPAGRAARVAGREIGGLAGDSWREVRKNVPKGIGEGSRKVGQAAIIGGAAALMGHLFGPVGALGTMVGSFAPLAKIARELEAMEAEPADDADAPASASPDDAADPEHVAPQTKTKTPARARARRKR